MKMKKILSGFLSFVMCTAAIGAVIPASAAEADYTYNLAMTDYSGLEQGYRQREIKGERVNFASKINAEDSANEVYTNWVTDSNVSWTVQRTEGEGVYLRQEGANAFNMLGYGGAFAADLMLQPAGKAVTAITGGQTKIQTQNANTAISEVRYMVNSGRTSYIAFGYDGAEQKAYYSVDGTKTYNTTVWNKNHNDDDDDSNTASGKTEYPQLVNVSFSINGGTINYTVTTNTQNTTPTWTGSFALNDIGYRQAKTAYHQEMFTDTSGDSNTGYTDVSLSYKASDCLVKNFERTSVSESGPSVQVKSFSQQIYNDPNGTIWSCIKHGDGDGYAQYDSGYGDSGLKITSYGAKMSADGVLTLDGNDFNGIKSGFAMIKVEGVNEADKIVEARYLVDSERTKYISFGIAYKDGVKTPYYQIDAAGAKNYCPADLAAASAYGNWALLDFIVTGNDITFKISADEGFASAKTWQASFSVSDMASRVNNCAIHRSYYCDIPWDKQTGVIREKLSYYYTEVGTPTLVEDFEGFTAENSAYGFTNRVANSWDTAAGNPGEYVIAANANGLWERSRFLDGQDTSGGGNDQSSGFVVDAEDAEIALCGSSTTSGLNFYPANDVWEMRRMEFEMSVARNKYNAVRFLISDDEKSAYELGVDLGGKFYVVKKTSLWAENYNNFGDGMVDATGGVPNTISANSIVPWDDGKGYNDQPEYKYNITIVVNDLGFDYKVSSADSGAVVFAGTYIDPEGKRISPAPGNPVISLVTSNSQYPSSDASAYYSKTILDDLKLWYTPLVKPNASYADDTITVNIAPNQMGETEKMIVIVVQSADSGEIKGCEAQSVTDMTQGSTEITFAKKAGATEAKVLVWEGDAEDVWPMLDTAIPVEL